MINAFGSFHSLALNIDWLINWFWMHNHHVNNHDMIVTIINNQSSVRNYQMSTSSFRWTWQMACSAQQLENCCCLRWARSRFWRSVTQYFGVDQIELGLNSTRSSRKRHRRGILIWQRYPPLESQSVRFNAQSTCCSTTNIPRRFYSSTLLHH